MLNKFRTNDAISRMYFCAFNFCTGQAIRKYLIFNNEIFANYGTCTCNVVDSRAAHYIIACSAHNMQCTCAFLW